MEETVPTIHIRMVRRNILCVKKRQDGNLSHPHRNKIGPTRCLCAVAAMDRTIV
ncbi:hypothetical protein DM82_3280 [Burkholderia oklahomensis]|uniref:Uncharacterized protein n=1 Tax=Burkholderia oklahomensis TaxID=342113 RepID=A0AAI8FP40_9BURK|nr:hypothetical protein DM82_3280 [Burkholderia oklahomensis]AJX32731.1 hypothetical protein BG90_1487 [Burkholderia oklahomensis C6786]